MEFDLLGVWLRGTLCAHLWVFRLQRRWRRSQLCSTLPVSPLYVKRGATMDGTALRKRSESIALRFVEAKRLLVALAEKVEPLDVNIRSFERPFEEAPEGFPAHLYERCRVHRTANVDDL